MIKIMFFGNWGESPSEMLKEYAKLTPNCSGIWKNIEGTNIVSEADYYIVMEGTSFDLNPDKAIYIKREPDFIKPNNDELNNYRKVITWKDQFCGESWWISKSYDELSAMRYPKKNKKVSCIVSNKHLHRRKFVRSLYKRRLSNYFCRPTTMDLYGLGHERKYFGNNYKGAIVGNNKGIIGKTGDCKLVGLESYQYTLVMENSCQKNYWTEKLTDAYLSWCVPIYWGCPNLNEYFDKESYYPIKFTDSIDYIEHLANTPVNSEMTDRLADAREKILNEYNIWNVIWRVVKEIS